MNSEALVVLAKRNHALLLKDVDGISDEQALVPLFEGGSHLNWLVAHLVAGRDHMLTALGEERVRAKEVSDAYDYGSTPPTKEEALPFAQHVQALVASNERLVAALQAATPEQLSQPHKKGTVGQHLEFMLWHEAYHTGQATLYRRAAGLKSPIG